MTEMPGQQKENVLSRFMERLDPWIIGGAACFLLISGFLFFFDTLHRLVFNETYDWTLELAVFSVVWAVFIGAGPAYVRGQHVAMTILSELMGKDRFRPIEFVMHGIMTVFCFLMTWQGVVLAQKAIVLGNSTPALDPLNVGYFKLCIPLGMLFFTLYALSEAMKSGLILFSPGSKSKDLTIEKNLMEGE
jgi:TRAP-type C4-dicarboxylate transport system permease small subunit